MLGSDIVGILPLRLLGEQVRTVNTSSNSHTNNPFTVSTEKFCFLNIKGKTTQLA